MQSRLVLVTYTLVKRPNAKFSGEGWSECDNPSPLQRLFGTSFLFQHPSFVSHPLQNNNPVTKFSHPLNASFLLAAFTPDTFLHSLLGMRLYRNAKHHMITSLNFSITHPTYPLGNIALCISI